MEVILTYLGVFGSAALTIIHLYAAVPLYIVVPAGTLLWGIVIAVCRYKKGTGCLNGVGTRLYGKRTTVNGYISTKWIVFMYIPLFPVAAYEVFHEENLKSYSESTLIYYRMLPGFCLRQMLLTLLIGWSIITAIILAIIIL
jgi:hypothetical protein